MHWVVNPKKVVYYNVDFSAMLSSKFPAVDNES